MHTNHNHTNQLIHATSPYLLQHAHNPVNWMPWSMDAWELARNENKPVIVSIGYSACHWCHVMEHESFEKEDVAEIMNRSFISIKVDREERPDVDLVYMDACQLITGKGGWPLNSICLPNGTPIFAGTYFPRENWTSILEQIAELWLTNPEKAIDYGQNMLKGLQEMNIQEKVGGEKFAKKDLPGLFQNLQKNFDLVDGGMNKSPKFPMPNNYEFLLDYYLISSEKNISEYIHLSLLKMANGGIYDHLRGGFYRYSTDRYWFAPHFEKMLYDNAQLISLYSRAWAMFNLDIYQNVVKESLAFCFRELKMKNGGYYAALDADSEGIEGRFYVFTYTELEETLTADELHFSEIIFGCNKTGNWEHGFNILHKPLSPAEALSKLSCTANTYNHLLQSVTSKLFQLQETRIKPGLDNKIIASWNGLMVKALADASHYLQSENYLNEAQNLAHWIWDNLQENGSLFRVYAQGNAKIKGFSEDYACIINGLLALYEADLNEDWIRKAEILTETAIQEFYDSENMVFNFIPKSGEQLIIQKSDISDDVISSSNSMFCESLQKLGVILNNATYSSVGSALLDKVRQQVVKYPGWYSNWARAAIAEGTGFVQVGIIHEDSKKLVSEAKIKLPGFCTILGAHEFSNLPFFEHKLSSGTMKIYTCLGNTCFEPLESLDKTLEMIQDLTTINN